MSHVFSVGQQVRLLNCEEMCIGTFGQSHRDGDVVYIENIKNKGRVGEFAKYIITSEWVDEGWAEVVE